MAQNKNSRKSEGLCQKIGDAVSPFRSTIRLISHQPQGSISITSDKKTPSQTTENPVRIISPQTKPLHVLHQPSLSKIIPVESEPPAAHFSAQETKALTTLSPVVQSAGKENSTGNTVQEFADKEIWIVRGQKFAKSASRKRELSPPEKASSTVSSHGKVEKVAPTEDKRPNEVQFAKARSKKDDESMQEGKFSDYICKVKNRMMETASNVGGGDGRTSPRRQHFNDKVTN